MHPPLLLGSDVGSTIKDCSLVFAFLVTFIKNNANDSKMDAKDKRILHELSKNARIPIKHLAKIIRMSESSTIYRLERLEKKGILLGTHAIINSYKLGYLGFRAYLFLQGTTRNKEDEILNWLTSRTETSVIGITQHNEEIIIMSWVKSIDIFNNFIKQFKENYGEFIKDFQIFSYVGTIYYPRNYLNPKNKGKEIIVRTSVPVDYDSLDLSILKQLSVNGRKTALKISKELNKPVKTIINRMKLLIKKEIIIGYSANIDLNKIGYEYYKINLIFSKNINYNTLLSFARELDNSIYVDEAISKYDFELNIEVENKEELNAIINNIKQLTGGIKHIEIKQISKYLKLSFLN